MTCEMEHGVFLFHWLISIHFLLITCIPKCLDLLGIILIPLLLGHSGMLCEFYIYIYYIHPVCRRNIAPSGWSFLSL